MKKSCFLFFLLLTFTPVVFGQKNTGLDEYSVSFQNLRQVQNLSKEVRDSMLLLFKKAQLAANVKGQKKEKEAAPKQLVKLLQAMRKLLVKTLEHPASAAANQAKMDLLIKKMDLAMDEVDDEMDYAAERQEILDDFKDGDYDSAAERRQAKKEMKQALKELKAEYKEQKKQRKNGF